MPHVPRLLLAAAVIALAACASVETAPSPAQAGTTGSWQLSFHLSGGFAGMDRRLELSSTGALTVRDRKRSTDVGVQVAASEVARIAALIPDMKVVAAGGRSTCRDCFNYDLEIQGQGRSQVVHLDDVTLANSGIEPFVKILTRLLDDALAGRLSAPQTPP
ncbi:MAG: hypothetical protein ABI868_23120 [Acidobacteriota bacterium]